MRVTDTPLDALQPHPSQFLFHDLGGEEWQELVKDVRERGIQQPITISDRTGEMVIVDGHQRARAAKAAGLKDIPTVTQPFEDERAETLALVMANLRRRHLNREERRQVIAQMLKLYPEKSNRQHAAELGVDHKTVKAQRQDMEALGEIPQVERLTTSDGKSRPATQAPSKPKATGDFRQSPQPVSFPASQAGKLPDPAPSKPVVDTVPSTPPPAEIVAAPTPEPKEDLEPWQVDHSQVIDLTPTPFEQHLEAIGYEEAQSFEKLAQKLIAALTEFNKYSDGDLVAIAESKAGKGLYAPMRLRRINDLMEEARGRLRRRDGTITVDTLN